MPNPSYLSSSNSNATSGITPRGLLPTGTVDGNFLIACVAAATPITGAPPGWQLVNGPTVLTGTVNAAVYTKIAQSEPASWNWALSSSGAQIVHVVAVQDGVALDGATAFQINAASTIVEAGSVSPVQTSDLLVGFFLVTRTTTFTPDPAMTEVQDKSSGAITLETAFQNLVAAGPTGPRDATQAQAAAVNMGWLGAVRGVVLAASPLVTIQSSASLSTAQPIAASSQVTVVSSAALTIGAGLSASSLVTIQSSAALRVGVLLSASSTITIVTSGVLSGQGAQFAVSSLITFQTSANLTAAALFAADALITFQSTATLTAVGADLAASAVITFQSTADLTTQAAGAALAASALITFHSSASLTTVPLVPVVSRRGHHRIRFHAATDAIAQPKQARVTVTAGVVRLSYEKLYLDADPGVLPATVEVGGSASQVMVSTCDVDAYPQAAHVDTSAATVTVRTVQNLTDEELLAVSIAARRRRQKSTQADNPRRK